MDLVLDHTGQKPPFENASAEKSFYVLIETSGSNEDHDAEKLSGLLEGLLEAEVVSDGVLADNATQLASLWSLRESIPEAAGKLGKVYKVRWSVRARCRTSPSRLVSVQYDLSMPVPSMYSLVEEARERFAKEGLDKDGSIRKVVGYGHVGDGVRRARSSTAIREADARRRTQNLHINIVARAYEKRIEQAIEPWIYSWVGALRRASLGGDKS
jgi:FAD/FMN-containing dehydrogenase